MTATKKVIFNTGVLYCQLIIGMITGLITTRIILNALGETNYGIYMVVAGIAGMLGILNSNMSNTSMRYMAHSLGTGDKDTLHKTFNTTLFLHIAIGIVVILMLVSIFKSVRLQQHLSKKFSMTLNPKVLNIASTKPLSMETMSQKF